MAAFDIHDVNANPARWDQKKAEAINAEHIRRLAPEDFTARLVPYLQRDGVLSTQPSGADLERLAAVAALLQTRVNVLSEATPMVAPFYLADDALPVADDARAQLKDDAAAGARRRPCRARAGGAVAAPPTSRPRCGPHSSTGWA